MLLVSDMDGTMLGDVAASKKFKSVWDTTLAPAGLPILTPREREKKKKVVYHNHFPSNLLYVCIFENQAACWHIRLAGHFNLRLT